MGTAVLTLAGCVQVGPPGMERSAFNILSESQENQLGEEAYQQVLAESKVSRDQQMTEVVRRVGQRIVAVANKPDFDWEFTLIESDQVNAFCLPGGKIAVYTGILPVMENEAGMAVVLGHEVGHAIYRHGGQRVSQNAVASSVLQVAKFSLGDASPAAQQAILGSLGAGAQVGVLLPFSRSHELEADSIGLIFAAEAGYDPREAVPLWERMAALGGGKNMEFLSTHPAETTRIQRLNEQMPNALQVYEKSPQKTGKGVIWGKAKTVPGAS
jgi:predicted Zn-dependent protease